MPKIFQRTPGGNYYVRLYHGSSERWVSLRTSSKREAERRAGRMLYATLPAVLQSAIERPKTTLAELWEAYLQSPAYKSLKESTTLERARSWEIFAASIGAKCADDVTQPMVIDYLNGVAKRASASTARKCKAQMSGVWREVGYKFPGLPNPWIGLPKIRDNDQRKRTGAFTEAQIDAILAEAKTRRESWYQMILVALYTGLRLKDLVHLRHEQLKDGDIVLVPAKTARSGKPVRVPCHPSIRVFFGPGEGYLWPEEVERYKTHTIHTVYFRKMLEKLGIKSQAGERLGIHSFRATLVTQLENAGVDRRRIRSAVGHDSDEQTREYSDVRLTRDDILLLPTRA